MMSDTIGKLEAILRAATFHLGHNQLASTDDRLVEALSLLSQARGALTAYQARAEAAEARVGYLQTIIDCVVANCEASASSYQERIETIHRVTSALALEWAEDSATKGTPDGR